MMWENLESLIGTKEYAYIWLQRILRMGSVRAFDLLAQPLKPQTLCRMDRKALEATGLFTEAELARLERIQPESILRTIRYCKEHDIRIITPEDAEYPEGFRLIEAPPVVIYARGLPLEQDCPMIGIVGTRESSELGDQSSYSLAARLATAGFTVVSGGALGIDRMAHIGAMNAGGKTIVILGSGIDSSYLRVQGTMRKRAERHGTVLSELEPKTPAAKYTFPARNRLISALSCGVAVIEAGQKSGALITATYAMEQGKEVFSMPGNIDLEQYVGTNALLRDGAIPLLAAQDVLEVYIGRYPDKLKTDMRYSDAVKKGYENARPTKRKSAAGSRAAKVAVPKIEAPKEQQSAVTPNGQEIIPAAAAAESLSCSAAAKRVYAAFSEEIELSDTLMARSGVSGGAFIAAVTELELTGRITAIPVGRYKRNF